MEERTFPPEYQQQIESWLKQVKFRRRLFGGVDETQVWTKIRELNDMYRDALIAERARCDALIAEHAGGATEPDPAGSAGDEDPEDQKGGSQTS